MKKSKKILAGVIAVCLMGGIGVIPEGIAPAVSMTASAEVTVPSDLTFVGKGSEGNFYCEYYSDDTLDINGYQGVNSIIAIPESINEKKVRSLNINRMCYYSSISDIYVLNSVALVGYNTTYTADEAVATMKNNGITLHIVDTLPTDIPEEPQIRYTTLTDGTIEITGCDKSATSIEIPAEIDGVKVTSIGRGAFARCSNLAEITIPDSITEIGEVAFGSCKGLKEITIPDGVKTIKDSTFEYCEGLTKITIPNGVETIQSSAFSGCSALTSVTLPDSLKTISPLGIFTGCTNLNTINVSENNENYSSIDGVVFSKDKTEIVVYPVGKTDSSYVIPDSVTSISNATFEYCSNLTEITIPNSVKSIGSNAFYRCYGLKSITIPDSVESIGSLAFGDCTSLEKIILPNSITRIESGTFEYCSALKEIKIPDNVTSIEYDVFKNCTSLKEITIPESLTNINSSAFHGALWMEIKREENPLVIVNGNLIDGTTCSGDVVIPESVTKINEMAFENCNIVSIIIPYSVTIIDRIPFYGCANLTEMKILNPKCVIYNYSTTINSNVTIYGYADSTAQAYAEKYDRKFVALDDEPSTSTTTTKTTTTNKSTTTTTTVKSTTTATTTATTGTTTTSKPTNITYGDANGDGEVNISDTVLIMQSITNPSEYKMLESAKDFADVVDKGDGITGMDALAIQMTEAKLIRLEDLPTTSDELNKLVK